MKKIAFIFICLFIGYNVSFSQSIEALEKTAIRDAQNAAKATLKMDFETVLEYTHPAIIENSGGKEILLKTIAEAFKALEAQDFVFEKAEVVRVFNIVKENGEFHCLVENSNQMKVTGTRIKSKSYLFGFYDDNKEQWYFLEAERLKNEALIAQFFPNFKTAIEIPEDETITENID